MRAQGLSIKYIVLLALGILVLVLIIFMLYRVHTSSNSINRENAINTCRELCVEAENIAVGSGGNPGKFNFPPNLGVPKYCTVTLNIGGENKHCYEIYTCTLTDGDGDPYLLDKNGCENWV